MMDKDELERPGFLFLFPYSFGGWVAGLGRWNFFALCSYLCRLSPHTFELLMRMGGALGDIVIVAYLPFLGARTDDGMDGMEDTHGIFCVLLFIGVILCSC